MEIRISTMNDVDEIMNIFSTAREYMVSHGNATQWENGYPSESVLKNDITNGSSYVITENGNIVGTFSFIIGEEPTYQLIKNGNWHCGKLYGTIHRLASNGTVRGIAKTCFEYCAEQIDYLRIDTHKNNQSMQNAIVKFGFRRCGNIYVRDGSECIAYDYLRAE